MGKQRLTSVVCARVIWVSCALLH